jgi:hypothetical protein
MSIEEQQARIKLVIENAIDFLLKAIEELEDNPKYSVIHFHAAVELILKARLMAEHWTLVIARNQEPDWDKFIAGDFQSVSLKEAASRLEKVVRSGLSKSEYNIFLEVTKHRNKIIHFYHEDDSPDDSLVFRRNITSQQLRAWHFLNKLMTEKWEDVFASYKGNLSKVEESLRKHHDFLKVVFEDMNEKIEKLKGEGSLFRKCPSCDFTSQEYKDETNEFYVSECLVCGLTERSIQIACDECDERIYFRNEGYAYCEKCDKKYAPNDLISIFEKGNISHDDDYSLGNCSTCDGYQTIVQINDSYVCCDCFDEFDSLTDCDWCGEPYSGYYEITYLTGCCACEGKGWDNID